MIRKVRNRLVTEIDGTIETKDYDFAIAISPDGSIWKITIDNNGVLITEKLEE